MKMRNDVNKLSSETEKGEAKGFSLNHVSPSKTPVQLENLLYFFLPISRDVHPKYLRTLPYK